MSKCLLLTLAAALLSAASSQALPFCMAIPNPTLTADAEGTPIIVFGRVTESGKKTADRPAYFVFRIEVVVRDDGSLVGRRELAFDGIWLPIDDPASPSRYLLFVDKHQGALDPFRAVKVSTPAVLEYLAGASKARKVGRAAALGYCADFLDHKDETIAADAHREFAASTYKDFADLAPRLSAARIAASLEDPKTPPDRLNLYALLLGHCGKAEHVRSLKAFLEGKREGSRYGAAVGVVLIDPANWDYVERLMLDTSRELQPRYAAFRATQFFWSERPDVVPQSRLVRSMVKLADVPDMADFAIEQLRHWKRWKHTRTAIELFDRKSHDDPLIKRAILRFALRSPEEKAKTFTENQHRRDPKMVADVVKQLGDESD